MKTLPESVRTTCKNPQAVHRRDAMGRFPCVNVVERNEIVRKLQAGLTEREQALVGGEMWPTSAPIRSCADLLASSADAEQRQLVLGKNFRKHAYFLEGASIIVQSAIARWRFSTAAKLIAYRPALDPAGHIPLASSSWTREG